MSNPTQDAEMLVTLRRVEADLDEIKNKMDALIAAARLGGGNDA